MGYDADIKNEIIAKERAKVVNRAKDSNVGQNTNMLLHSMDIFDMPKINTDNAEDVYDRSIEYLQICADHDKKPTIAGYTLALGVSRATFTRWLNGKTQKPKEVVEVLEKMQSLINAQLEDYMTEGMINPVSGIFLAKNNFGYTDKTEMIVTPNKVEETSPERLIEEGNMLNEV